MNEESPKYDGKSSYQWKPEELFPIKGIELEYMFRITSDYLSSPEAQHVLRMLEAHKILESKIKEGVESGIVIPQE